MNADQHLIEINGSIVATLQMQLALARAERDTALQQVKELKETLDSYEVKKS